MTIAKPAGRSSSFRPLLAVAVQFVFLFCAGVSISAVEGEVGRNDTFRIAIGASDIEMNPMYAYIATEAQVFTGLYEGLVGYNPLTLSPVPGVANRWEQLDGGTRYRFYLRSNARFDNGDPVTARDFRDTWLALLSLGDDAPYSSLFDIIVGARSFRRSLTSDPDSVGVRVVSERVLDVELNDPAPHFLDLLAHHSFSPLHSEVLGVRDLSDPATHIGNGPYQLRLSDDEMLVLDRNENYWAREAVAMERIVYEHATSQADATRRFFEGRVDWNAGAISFEGRFDNTDLVVNPLFATTFYFIRAELEPWSDPRVRRALALMLPWSEIRDSDVFFIPTTRLVPAIPGYPEPSTISEQDIEAALHLLEEAGFPDGEGLPDMLIRIPGGDSSRVAALMLEGWDRLSGVTISVETVSYPRYFEIVGDPDVTVGIFSWIGDHTDPLTFLQLWTSDSTLNEAGHHSPEYDQLVEEAGAREGSQRYELMSEAEALLLESGTILPVSHSAAFNLINLERFDGWFPNPLDIHPVRYIRRVGDEPAPGLVQHGTLQAR